MRMPFSYIPAEQALSVIKSGDRVFVQGSAQTPLFLMRELAKMAPNLKDVELTFITVQGDIVVDKPEFADSFHINCMFVSESVRQAVNEGRADFIPKSITYLPE